MKYYVKCYSFNSKGEQVVHHRFQFSLPSDMSVTLEEVIKSLRVITQSKFIEIVLYDARNKK